MPVTHSLYRESGRITVNREACTKCGVCVRACPADVLKIENGVQASYDGFLGCIACGHCMMVCPENAITVTGRGVKPDDIAPLPHPDDCAEAVELEALMRSRRSIRRFENRDVDPDVLERIVSMAAMAPMGIPPWDVGCVTVRGRDNVRKLADSVVDGYEGFLKIFKPWLLKVMRPFMGAAKYEMFSNFVVPLAHAYVQGRQENRDLVFYDAPALLLFHHSPYTESADAVIACTYAMLAAESLGLGSTMIGGAPPILQRNKKLCRDLGIPPGNKPAMILILGYPAVRFHRAIRRRFT